MNITSENVVNRTGGIETKDGRILYGLDAETYLKMTSKEDPELEKKVAKWIESVMGIKFSSYDLGDQLKSGIVLCNLVNILKNGTIPKFNKRSKNGSDKIHVLMEVENINLYLKACWKLGVPSSDLFTVNDLHQKRGMSSVVSNLISLSRIAFDSLGCKIKPIGPSVVSLENKEPYKWNVDTGKSITTHDIEGDSVVSLLNDRLKKSEQSRLDLERKLIEMENKNDSLEKKLKELETRRSPVKGKTDNIINKETLKSKEDISPKEKISSSTNVPERPNRSNPASLLQIKLSDYENENRELKKKIISLQKQKTTISTNYKQEKALNESLTFKYNQASNEIERLKAEIMALKKARTDSEEEPNNDVHILTIDMVEKKVPEKMRHSLKKIKLELEKEESKLRAIATEDGQSIFFYEKKIDESLIHFTSSLIERIIYHGDMEPSDCELLDHLFKFDTGRRLFIFILKGALQKRKSYRLKSGSYQLLLYTFHSMMTEMYSISSKDFNTMVLIYKLSKKIYFFDEFRNNNHYLQRDIRKHFIWLNLAFWDHLFMDTTSKMYSNKVNEIDGSVQSEKETMFIYRSLKSFCYNMLQWGLPLEIVDYFQSMTSQHLHLPDKQSQAIATKIAKFNLQLEKSERKAKKRMSKND